MTIWIYCSVCKNYQIQNYISSWKKTPSKKHFHIVVCFVIENKMWWQYSRTLEKKGLWNLNHLICWLTTQHLTQLVLTSEQPSGPWDWEQVFYCPHGVKCAFISMNRSVNKVHSTADESPRRRHTHTNTLNAHTHLTSPTIENVRDPYGATLLRSAHTIYHVIKSIINSVKWLTLTLAATLSMRRAPASHSP